VIGDIHFFHSGIGNLINAVYNRSAITVVVLDNSITGMTGHQQNPTTGLDIRLQPAPVLDLEALCAAIGVRSIRVVDPADTFASQKVLAEEMARPDVSVVIARRPCALIPTGKGTERAVVDYDKCTKCGACLRLMCPALTPGADGKPVVDPDTCNGCGLCIGVCRFGALGKEKK
jgi:indolepyruvate ferredoxin oxidoreductase alpha subunit